jgi:hypothetical protein
MMVLDMWLAVGSDSRPPARRDLMPESIAGALTDTWLMDYEAQSRSLRYRLVGENIRAHYGAQLVGRSIDEILAPEARDSVMSYFHACVEKPAVSLLLGRLYHERERPGYGERLLLPLLNPDGSPEGLLGVTLCKLTLDSQAEAEERAKRVMVILPLDGSPAIEASS